MSGLVAGTSSPASAAPTAVCLYFYADWHPSHSQLTAVFNALPSVAPNVTFKSVPAETTPDLVSKYGVTVVPTTVLCTSNGTVAGKIDTADVAEITRQVTLLNKSASVTKPPPPTPSSSSSSSNPSDQSASSAPPHHPDLPPPVLSKIKALLASSPVLLCMKGTPSDPKCGFSRQAVELLRSSSVSFSSFDILANSEVRKGLKVHSDWPTYPQLYVRGELQGGLDVLKEMAADGDLAEQVRRGKRRGELTPF